MALQVAGSFKPRELPDWVKEAFHKKLDEALSMYEAGHPLWITSHAGAFGKDFSVNLDIYLKDSV